MTHSPHSAKSVDAIAESIEAIEAKWVGPRLAALMESHWHERDVIDLPPPRKRRHRQRKLPSPDSLKTAAQAAPKRRRKPSIAAMVKRAEKAGKIVTSVSVEGDKVILTFGESNPTDANNPWLAEIEKATKR
jgi:hypothetical protein